jgi:acyl-CoA thioester hydrolase
MDTTWDLPHPYVLAVTALPADIDAYRHVNNAVYIAWLDRAAWAHSTALGLPVQRCLQLDRGMAVVRTVASYLRPALEGDRIDVATWIVPSEGRARVRRRFQLHRHRAGETILRAEVDYVCIELSSGRPIRWPPEFRDVYAATAEVSTAAETLEPL